MVLHQWLTLEEAEQVLKHCHSGACGDHLSGLSTSHKIIYTINFFHSLFPDCICLVNRCTKFQIFTHKTRDPLAPLHPIIIVVSSYRWGIDFMACNPPSSGVHKYIIVAIDYFTKWAKGIPIYNNIMNMVTHVFLQTHHHSLQCPQKFGLGPQQEFWE